MTKPRIEVALLRLLRAVERGDCGSTDAYECFLLGYGGMRLPSPRGLKAECRRIPGLKAVVRGKLLRLTFDE